MNNAAIGGVLITIVLLVFFPWRAMVWVVAGLPVAVLISMSSMQLLGMEFSVIVMVSIIMMLGLLVDDAIVTSESIYSHYEQGLAPRAAALEGTNAIARPVITGALTTILAMSPLLLISGIESKYMWVLTATVVFVVIGSLFECLFLLPSHLAESLRKGARKQRKNNWFVTVERHYRRLLKIYLRKPLQSITVLLLGTILAFFAVSKYINFEPYPEMDSDLINIIAELPSGSSMDDTYRALNIIEQRINNSSVAEYIDHSYMLAGNHDLGEMNYMIGGQHKNWGKVVVRLMSFNDRSISAQEIAAGIKEATADLTQFSRLDMQVQADKPPSGKPVELQVILDDDARHIIAGELEHFLETHPAVTTVWSNYLPGRSLIDLQLDHKAMARYGLKTVDITRALRVAYDGVLFDQLQTREELIRFRLKLQDNYRSDINALRSLTVLNQEGETIPLRNIASFELKQGYSSIIHYSGFRAETIFAGIDRDSITPQQINDELRQFISDKAYLKQHSDLRFHFGGELEDRVETTTNMSNGLLLVLASIFFLMVLLFNSLSLPIAALLLIPVSFLVVLLVFVIHGLTIGVTALVGLLGLIGVLMNDALVMIDRISKRHLARSTESSILCLDDIIDGAVDRLRPLLITAITTLIGLGPAAYGIAGFHPATQDLLLVMFWGVAVGALVTLFTLPLYLVLDSRCKSWFRRRLKRLSIDDSAEGSGAPTNFQ